MNKFLLFLLSLLVSILIVITVIYAIPDSIERFIVYFGFGYFVGHSIANLMLYLMNE